MSTNILVTGAAGYIGSHTCVALLEAGYNVIALDNLSNSSHESIRRVEQLTGKRVRMIQGDVRNPELLHHIFHDPATPVEAVIHFAGSKSVAESVAKPLTYYQNNVAGSANLFEMMRQADIRKLIFSSSACVYGDSRTQPVREDFAVSSTSPYGRTKLMIEDILEDLYASESAWRIGILRYFNPVGAHSSGQIGEEPRGAPNNLMPYITQVAVGRLKQLSIYGNDYPTPDGTGVRDYIHVMDLAEGHVRALQYLDKKSGLHTINLGTGKGYSVLELVKAFEQASGREIPYQFVARRPGDVATSYADTSRATRELGWTARRTLEEMCRDSWAWQSANPHGYADK